LAQNLKLGTQSLRVFPDRFIERLRSLRSQIRGCGGVHRESRKTGPIVKFSANCSDSHLPVKEYWVNAFLTQRRNLLIWLLSFSFFANCQITISDAAARHHFPADTITLGIHPTHPGPLAGYPSRRCDSAALQMRELSSFRGATYRYPHLDRSPTSQLR